MALIISGFRDLALRYFKRYLKNIKIASFDWKIKRYFLVNLYLWNSGFLVLKLFMEMTATVLETTTLETAGTLQGVRAPWPHSWSCHLTAKPPGEREVSPSANRVIQVCQQQSPLNQASSNQKEECLWAGLDTESNSYLRTHINYTFPKMS